MDIGPLFYLFSSFKFFYFLNFLHFLHLIHLINFIYILFYVLLINAVGNNKGCFGLSFSLLDSIQYKISVRQSLKVETDSCAFDCESDM